MKSTRLPCAASATTAPSSRVPAWFPFSRHFVAHFVGSKSRQRLGPAKWHGRLARANLCNHHTGGTPVPLNPLSRRHFALVRHDCVRPDRRLLQRMLFLLPMLRHLPVPPRPVHRIYAGIEDHVVKVPDNDRQTGEDRLVIVNCGGPI